MRRRGFVLALLACILAAPALATAGGARPFKGRVTAQWDNIFAALPPSLGGAGLAHFVGGGQVTHMGNTEQSGTLVLVPNGGELIPGFGSVTIVAANGDTVSFDYVGLLNPATGEGIGTFAFTGGTGRFADVSGGGTFYALIDLSVPTGQPMTVVLDGQIGY
jgi:hypothetical protein